MHFYCIFQKKFLQLNLICSGILRHKKILSEYIFLKDGRQRAMIKNDF